MNYRGSLLERWAGHYSNATPAEAALEPALASLGVRYRFQHPVWSMGVFPDFYLPDYKLIIEVDDASHRTSAKRKADAKRTQGLEARGFKVVRCTNEEALADPFATVDSLMERAQLPLRTKPNPNQET